MVSGLNIDFDGEDGLKLALVLAVVAIVALSVVAGIVLTVVIIKRTAANDRLLSLGEMQCARAQ